MSDAQRRMLPPDFLVDRSYSVKNEETGEQAIVVEGVRSGRAALALISDKGVELL